MNIGKNCVFYEESSALPGVKYVAALVKKDIELVTGSCPESTETLEPGNDYVLYGTLGCSPLLDQLEQEGAIDLTPIRGKREVYLFRIIRNPVDPERDSLLIAGSDKRGTIYGLFHLSERMGVSPLVNWNHVWPAKQPCVVLDESVNVISKEPSVKYRGFFINDEWPAFGTWAMTHFGGVNAACYERIFELLLRLKGNYLWPAMWDSNFNLDGPGLKSAELADELGVVMSTSHHEPCMRSGQEYSMVRGEGSVYGDAWNFRSNPEGITRFWRDGLERNRSFEQVITMGMRGENDTAILGKEATLEDNIELLRDVLKTQNQLIRETISEDLSQVPRQIVLFTEVEEFFYGNENVKGLMGDEELEGVTLMLSDNNHGSTRTLPSEEMRDHNGGYGMYYHMDMHGGAHAFQWIGSTYLPKVCEEMTMAYDYGVREIWVTNIGDIGTQELGLSYFLDLAYDIEKWGGRDCAVTQEYTRQWVDQQFRAVYSKEQRETIDQIVWDYTTLLAKRKHEVMNDRVFHPTHYGEADEVLRISNEILKRCDALRLLCPKEHMGNFVSLLYYPACGTANLMKMWILSSKNHLYAWQNRVAANQIAQDVNACVERDELLVRQYHEVDNGYFYGLGLGEHIGFTNWNDEDNKYPERRYIYPANQPRMIISRIHDTAYVSGLEWNEKNQVWRDAIRPDCTQIVFTIACGSKEPIVYRIHTDCDWMEFDRETGEVLDAERVVLTIRKDRFDGSVSGTFAVEQHGAGTAVIRVEAENRSWDELPENTFVESDGCVCMEADHFAYKTDVPEGGFGILKPYGRTGTAIKAYPNTTDYMERTERPSVTYRFWAREAGDYELTLYLSATTPVVYERRQFVGVQMNDDELQQVNTVREVDKQFFLSRQWEQEAIEQIKKVSMTCHCREGLNELHYYAMSPAVLLERVVLHRAGEELPESYLGPTESYCVIGS